jgi:hypothetical protein
MEQLIKYVLGEMREIRRAPLVFVTALLTLGAAIWWALDWRYTGIVSNRDLEISSLKTQRDEYKEKLGGASPDQAKARIDALEQKVDELSKRTGPPYPLTDEQKDGLLKALQAVPPNERFHVTILWPQMNGLRRYADAVQQVFSSAKWAATVSVAGQSYAHGIFFIFNQQAYEDKSKRSAEAIRLMGFLDQAQIHYGFQGDAGWSRTVDKYNASYALVVGAE